VIRHLARVSLVLSRRKRLVPCFLLLDQRLHSRRLLKHFGEHDRLR